MQTSHRPVCSPAVSSRESSVSSELDGIIKLLKDVLVQSVLHVVQGLIDMLVKRLEKC